MAFAAENGDAVLSRLYSEYSALREPEERAWEAADPLVDAGVKEAKRQGIVNFDREWDRYFAIHIAVGARAAEQAADEISQRRAQLLEEIRATRPATVRGLAVKLEAMRQVVCIQDEGPREDQDWDHEFFNIFGDDLRSLIT